VVAGGAQSLEYLLAGGGILRQCRAGRSCNNDPGNHQGLHHLPPFLNSERRPCPAPVSARPETPPPQRASRPQPTFAPDRRAVRMALSAGSVNGPKGQFVPTP